MIKETVSHKNNPSLTSDRWHVVHARWSGDAAGEPKFERSIVSEHDDQESAAVSARSLETSLASEMNDRKPEQHDQLWVRRPDFKSLKNARRRDRP